MNKVYPFLLLVPAALVAHHSHASPAVVFTLTALALMPVAFVLGVATEHLADRAGPAVGGFLNATFGNATELIIGVIGLCKGGAAVVVVKASIVGSILGNLLLILGLAMLAGGWGRKRQTFSPTVAGTSNAMMVLAVAGLLLPTTVFLVNRAGTELGATRMQPITELAREHLSFWVAGILLLTYVLSLVFAFVTHTHVFVGPEAEEKGPAHDVWSLKKSLVVLVVSTLVIAYLSESLVHTVEVAGEALGLSPTFMGLVVVATVGNAAEHSSAILIAARDKMELAVQIALGSATQVALFLAPTLVLVSYLVAPEVMTLEFDVLEVVAVGMAVTIATLVSLDGESNWFEGIQLVSLYGMIAAAFFYLY